MKIPKYFKWAYAKVYMFFFTRFGKGKDMVYRSPEWFYEQLSGKGKGNNAAQVGDTL
jgi:hypothetical protein